MSSPGCLRRCTQDPPHAIPLDSYQFLGLTPPLRHGTQGVHRPESGPPTLFPRQQPLSPSGCTLTWAGRFCRSFSRGGHAGFPHLRAGGALRWAGPQQLALPHLQSARLSHLLTGTCPAKLIPFLFQEGLGEEMAQPQRPSPVDRKQPPWSPASDTPW